MTVLTGTASLDVVALSKRFGSTRVLDNVAFGLPAGCIDGLIGENGAGKSTFIKLLAGIHRPDAGSIRWLGSELDASSPATVRAAGIAVLHQEPQLIDTLDALENLFVGRRAFGRGPLHTVSRRALERGARELFADYDFSLPLRTLARDLSPAQRTVLGLARCLLDRPRLLVLDEPTTSLTATEVSWLSRVVRRLAAGGASIIFVSHRLDEVVALCDRVSVMRGGCMLPPLPAASQTRRSLVELMSGASAPPAGSQSTAAATARTPLFQIQRLSTVDAKVDAVSLAVLPGEIAGLYGLAGSGRTELLECAAGARARTSGRVAVDGADAGASPAATSRAGVCLIPEDRTRQALVARRSVMENVDLPYLHRFARFGVVRRRFERAAARATVRAFDVRTTGIDQHVRELSGGNQQKLVFARTWELRPRVLLCDEPTQGVDEATRRAIHDRLREHAAGGGAALVVSSDLEELMTLADRIVVLREGRISASFERAAFDPRDILHACFPPEA